MLTRSFSVRWTFEGFRNVGGRDLNRQSSPGVAAQIRPRAKDPCLMALLPSIRVTRVYEVSNAFPFISPGNELRRSSSSASPAKARYQMTPSNAVSLLPILLGFPGTFLLPYIHMISVTSVIWKVARDHGYNLSLVTRRLDGLSYRAGESACEVWRGLLQKRAYYLNLTGRLGGKWKFCLDLDDGLVRLRSHLDHGRPANVDQALVQILVAEQCWCHNNHTPLFLSCVLFIISQV